MKKLLFLIIIVPCLVKAEGPLYKSKDVIAQQEFDNVYQDIRQVRNSVATLVSSSTLPSGSTNYIQNSANPTISTQVSNVSSGTFITQLTVGNPNFLNASSGGLKINGNGTSGYYVFITSNTSLATTGLAFGADSNNGFITTNGASTILQIQGNGSITFSSYTAAGAIIQPLQPSFLVTNSQTQNDVTGDGTVATVSFNNEIYDQGANIANSTFTAPVTGRYYLQANMLLDNILVTHTGTQLRINTSNRFYICEIDESLARVGQAMNVSVIADVDAGDTALVQVVASGGTKTVDIDPSAVYVFFSASLIN